MKPEDIVQTKPRLFDAPTVDTMSLACGLNLVGMSIGGVRTSLMIKGLGICFDVAQGWPFQLGIDQFFITHGHLDHAAGIPYLISQKNLAKTNRPQFYMPKSLVEPITNILKIWGEIEGHGYDFELIGLDVDEKVQINSQYFVHPTSAYHRVPGHVYTVFRESKKLKPEYQGLSGPEIVECKKRGEFIDLRTEKPILTFSGDSRIEFLFERPFIKEAQTLLIETTYVDDRKTIAHAREWGHIHIDEVIEALPQLNCEEIVLMHLSSRYSLKEARETLLKRIPKNEIPRVKIFPIGAL